MNGVEAKSGTVSPHGVSVPLRLLPFCATCSLLHQTKFPLPDASTELPCQVVEIESLSANAPVRSQVVVQMPALQPGVPPLAGHTLPHIPQLVTVSRLVSQPFWRLASQSPCPLLQTGLHA